MEDWIDLKNGVKPKSYERVLVAAEGMGVGTGYHCSTGWTLIDDDQLRGRRVTHWRPLPERPEAPTYPARRTIEVIIDGEFFIREVISGAYNPETQVFTADPPKVES